VHAVTIDASSNQFLAVDEVHVTDEACDMAHVDDLAAVDTHEFGMVAQELLYTTKIVIYIHASVTGQEEDA